MTSPVIANKATRRVKPKVFSTRHLRRRSHPRACCHDEEIQWHHPQQRPMGCVNEMRAWARRGSHTWPSHVGLSCPTRCKARAGLPRRHDCAAELWNSKVGENSAGWSFQMTRERRYMGVAANYRARPRHPPTFASRRPGRSPLDEWLPHRGLSTPLRNFLKAPLHTRARPVYTAWFRLRRELDLGLNDLETWPVVSARFSSARQAHLQQYAKLQLRELPLEVSNAAP